MYITTNSKVPERVKWGKRRKENHKAVKNECKTEKEKSTRSEKSLKCLKHQQYWK